MDRDTCLRLRPLILVMVCGLAVTSAAAAPQEPPLKLSDLVRVTVLDQALHIEWIGPLEPRERALPVAGPEAQWNVWSPLGVPDTLELHRPIAPVRQAGGFWIIGISVNSRRLSITAHRGGRAVYDTTLRLTQTSGDGGAVHLVVSDRVAGRSVQGTAGNLIELRATHPQLVREFLVPLLRQLSGHDPLLPGATDVYRVFEELAQDEAVDRAVRALLPGLGDPSFARRQRASRELEALAPQSVCAVLRMSRHELMPEQQVRLENLLLRHSHRLIPDPRAARRDPAFLADCLEFPGDERVRRSALRELEQLTGRKIPLHHAPTEEEWSHAADVVRKQLAQEMR